MSVSDVTSAAYIQTGIHTDILHLKHVGVGHTSTERGELVPVPHGITPDKFVQVGREQLPACPKLAS